MASIPWEVLEVSKTFRKVLLEGKLSLRLESIPWKRDQYLEGIDDSWSRPPVSKEGDQDGNDHHKRKRHTNLVSIRGGCVSLDE